MKLGRHFIPCVASGLIILTGAYWATEVMLGAETGEGMVGKRDGRFVVFDRRETTAIGLPEKPTAEERCAAEMIQRALVRASGRAAESFPITLGQENAPKTIHLRGSNHRRPNELRLGEEVTWRVQDKRVEITSYPADAIEAAAAWFLAQTLDARWFMPGKLGEYVPKRVELRLSVGEHSHRPSYISRNLGGLAGAEDKEWAAMSRLRPWFVHGHAMNDLFSRKALERNPDLASTIYNRKKIPASAEDYYWQPNIASKEAAAHAADVLKRYPAFSSRIGMNDNFRYDQSARTRELVGEPQWFRRRPDFSKLIFGFVNEVAKRVPGRYLGAYAYHWTENTPGFRIERNVIPYLTADRSEWFDPAFAEQDQALIKRWVNSGAEVVGLYDYYYGAPYLVPRPTLYAVTRSIPFAYNAGVRAFYAEVYPNWGLDGPKAWLAAELLWNASAKPEELLDIYYRDFWQEAAGPMREYFALCDQQWLDQPKPSYWIKYYNDEHQHLLFPAEVRSRLQDLLAAARGLAKTDLVRARVDFFAAAFAVSDHFCQWAEAKERLSRVSLNAKPDIVALQEAWQNLDAVNARMEDVMATVAKEKPLAVKATLLPQYLRNDPRRRTVWLMKDEPGAAAYWSKLGAPGVLQPTNKELLRDVTLAQLKIGPVTGFFDLEWVFSGPWRGHGEPYETRRVEIQKPESGRSALRGDGEAKPKAEETEIRKPETGDLKPEGANLQKGGTGGSVERGAKGEERSVSEGITDSPTALRLPPSPLRAAALVMRGCRQETLSQVVPAVPGRYYAARVKVRAGVSPGNMTYLMLNFRDADQKGIGSGFVDRLPVGDYPEETELIVWAQAPKEAKWVVLSARAINQVGEDYAAYSGFSLRELR